MVSRFGLSRAERERAIPRRVTFSRASFPRRAPNTAQLVQLVRPRDSFFYLLDVCLIIVMFNCNYSRHYVIMV